MRGVAPSGMRSRRVAGSSIGVSLVVTSTSTSGWPTAIRLTMPPGRSRIACSAGGEPMADEEDTEHEGDQRHRDQRTRLPHGVAPAPPAGSWPPGGVDATGPP